MADGLDVIRHRALAICGSSYQKEAGRAEPCSSAAHLQTPIAQASAPEGAAPCSQALGRSRAESIAEPAADSSSGSSSAAQLSASLTGSDATSCGQDKSATASSTLRDDSPEANPASQPGCSGQVKSAAQPEESEKLHLIVVDASSGDASLAMTCPPAAFIEQGFLKDVVACLRPEGVLAINFVTRSRDALTAAYQTLLVHLPATLACSLSHWKSACRDIDSMLQRCLDCCLPDIAGAPSSLSCLLTEPLEVCLP